MGSGVGDVDGELRVSGCLGFTIVFLCAGPCAMLPCHQAEKASKKAADDELVLVEEKKWPSAGTASHTLLWQGQEQAVLLLCLMASWTTAC